MDPITNTANVAPGVTAPISQTTIQIGGTTYVYAGSLFGNGGLNVFTLDAAGALTPVQTLAGDVFEIRATLVNGNPFLFVADLNAAAVRTYAIATDGTLTLTSSVFDNGATALGGATGLETLVVGGVTYVAVTGQNDNGISLFSVAADGSLTNTANLFEDATLHLARAYKMTTATVGAESFIIVQGNTDSGMSVLRVEPGGALTNVFNIADTATSHLAGSYDVATAVVGGVTYVFTGSYDEGGVSVFSLGAGGVLTNVFNIDDDGASLLGVSMAMTTFTQAGKTYLAVSAYEAPGGLTFFQVAADGSLTKEAEIADTAALSIGSVFGMETVVVGGRTFVIAGSESENGISVFDVGAAASVIPDSAKDDRFSVAENAGFVANVRNDNGFGADAPALAITAVNGQAASVGMKILLPSGAYLTLQANGTFQYLTNGAFNSLAGAASGAQNLTATDTFTYTVANGDTATVTVTINGVDGNGDILQGSVLADNLVAGVGSDTVNGLTGNDVIDGGDGNDILNGGAGNDILIGGAGIDRLDGGKGADTMRGGLGNDTYVVDDAGDSVTELANEGTDTVESSIDYLLGANVENLVLTGVANISGVGNALSNHMTGNAGANVLSAGAGNDFVYGMGGDDTLSGGAGVDTMFGGSGNDILDGGAGGDKLYGEVGDDTLIGGTEADVLDGGAGDDVINGGGGNDSLIGGTGKDTMRGGAGNDVYYVDNILDQVFELANEGEDVVNASVSFTLSSNVEVLNLTGTGNINGTGSSSNNRIYGNDGANTLDGGLGDDILVGGKGSDTYVVDSLKDVITELAGEGTDTVRASLSWTLGANLENLVLTGTAANGTGNAEANTLTGTDSVNVLMGLDGNDKLIGNGGDDRLVGGAGSDNLDGGTGNDRLEGGSGNNVLTGGTGADVFVFTTDSVRLSGSSNAAIQTDRITDFSAANGDRIDLSAIDADSTASGDQAFHFVSSFGFHAGEAMLTYEAGVNQTLLRLDIDGDGKADYQLRIDGDATGAAVLTPSSNPSDGGWLL